MNDMNVRLTLPTRKDEALLITTQDKSVLPFTPRRVFVIRDINHGAIRGKHAHKRTRQALFCIQGTMVIRLDDGKRKTTHRLSKPHRGIYIDRLVWSEMYGFSTDAVVLVFASDYYREQDYIRSYDDFLRRVR